MSDYKEKFEKMRVAGKLAAQTLDMLTASPESVPQQPSRGDAGVHARPGAVSRCPDARRLSGNDDGRGRALIRTSPPGSCCPSADRAARHRMSWRGSRG